MSEQAITEPKQEDSPQRVPCVQDDGAHHPGDQASPDGAQAAHSSRPPSPPRLLLVHGFLSGNMVWDRVRTDLEDCGIPTVAPNQLGYGEYRRSPSRPYTLQALARHLLPIVEREQPTHIVGHSMGGIVALELDRLLGGNAFHRIGIIGLPVFESARDGIAYQRGRSRKHRIYMRTHGFSHIGCEVLNRSRFAWSRFARRYAPGQPMEVLLTMFDHNFASHYHGLLDVAFGGLVPELARSTRADVILLHGTRDTTAPMERARAIAAAVGWPFETMSGANHQVVVERPLAVSNWIQQRVLDPALDGRR